MINKDTAKENGESRNLSRDGALLRPNSLVISCRDGTLLGAK
jgi:hypothetical protein